MVDPWGPSSPGGSTAATRKPEGVTSRIRSAAGSFSPSVGSANTRGVVAKGSGKTTSVKRPTAPLAEGSSTESTSPSKGVKKNRGQTRSATKDRSNASTPTASRVWLRSESSARSSSTSRPTSAGERAQRRSQPPSPPFRVSLPANTRGRPGKVVPKGTAVQPLSWPTTVVASRAVAPATALPFSSKKLKAMSPSMANQAISSGAARVPEVSERSRATSKPPAVTSSTTAVSQGEDGVPGTRPGSLFALWTCTRTMGSLFFVRAKETVSQPWGPPFRPWVVLVTRRPASNSTPRVRRAKGSTAK